MKFNLKYQRQNAEEDYVTTPISVLRYIGELERSRNIITLLFVSVLILFLGGILIGLNF